MRISERQINWLELLLIFVTAFVPLIFDHHYRINLFLAWEGAFRISNGEIPYRDFGMPVGYVFWLIPSLFFKIVGPTVLTLLIAQSFINLGSNLIFRELLKLLKIVPHVRLLTLIIYCLSFSLYNFWPWYNHFVFVLELCGMFFLCQQILMDPLQRSMWKLVMSAFFFALSFMTKQDTGALGLMIAIGVLTLDFVMTRRGKTAFIFLAGVIGSLSVLIGPFLATDFLYWFNFGQYPHNSRVDVLDLMHEFLGGSSWIKFYLVILVIVLLRSHENIFKNINENKVKLLHAFLVLAILLQASIIQVTSYTPINGNVYFHAFAFSFICNWLFGREEFTSLWRIVIISGLVALWWSGVFWTRFLRAPVERLFGSASYQSEMISKKNFIISNDTLNLERGSWVVSRMPSLNRIKIPQETETGIEELVSLPVWNCDSVKVLNMSELTSLSYDLQYDLEKGSDHPLWFHKNVAFFDREVQKFCTKIDRQEYDIILFQDIPDLNNFYPYEVRECIRKTYKLKFKFLAPRIPEISYIEVYVIEQK